MIEFRQEGDFRHLTNFFEKLLEVGKIGVLDKYGKMGVDALSSATPLETGETAKSWYYEIEQGDGYAAIRFCNSNTTKEGTPIAILLQYGHATRNGGFVEGVDYINPAIKPVFDEIARSAWEEVTSV